MLGEWLKWLLEQAWHYIMPFTVITDYESGVLLRFGRLVKVLTPGIHFKFPLIDIIITAHIKPDTMEIAPISITTLDDKTVSIGAIIEIEVIDVQKYLIEANEARSNIHDIIRGVMSDTLEDITWADIKKKKTINQIKRTSSESCEKVGIRLIDMRFTDKCISRVLKLFGDTHSIINTD